MILYHGSNSIVETPGFVEQIRGLDFGSGFYTTSNLEQAMRFAELVSRRMMSGTRCISTYQIDEVQLRGNFDVLEFFNPDEAWLDFVIANRVRKYQGKKYDVVIGPVANDKVYDTIQLFLRGTLTKEQTIQNLRVRNLYNQWTFCSERSLAMLVFVKGETL